MATARLLCLRQSISCPPPLLCFSLRSESTNPGGRGRPHHDFCAPCDFLGSWTPTSDPREAEARLDWLRKDYPKQVNKLCSEYAYEMEMLRIEKQRKDDCPLRGRALGQPGEEESQGRHRQDARRRALFPLKERTQKLESWRMKEKLEQEKKAEEKELLRRTSSMWVDEQNLEAAVSEAICNITPL